MTREKRRKSYYFGVWAERCAALLLIVKGYRVLASRYRTSSGEIDLVVARRRRIAFVEVKARSSAMSEEEVLCTVTLRQQQRIRRAASLWLARNDAGRYREIGFDIVVVQPWSLPRHYRDAFSHI